MKFIHTADIHLGHVLYQSYERADEHDCFIRQLEKWCIDEKPDALLISGDVFDRPQPSTTVGKAFTDAFVQIHKSCPNMAIVIVAGNHDSPSRIQEDSAVWKFANSFVVGLPPSVDDSGSVTNWKDFVVNVGSGIVIALPYMSGDRHTTVRYILDRVAEINTDNLPVVMMGHLTDKRADVTGHDFAIGNIQSQNISDYGGGYDYLALGHIHKPQTLGYEQDTMKLDVTYPSGIARYSGSALHVSCDEKYPHSVSVVEIPRHGGDVHIRLLQIEQLRHFFELPRDGGYLADESEALDAVRDFCENTDGGYFRLRLRREGNFPTNFKDSVYKIIEAYEGKVRFNPKHIWSEPTEKSAEEQQKPVFEVADIQQMTDPLRFIMEAKIGCPGLTDSEVTMMFSEVKQEVERMEEEKQSKSRKK